MIDHEAMEESSDSSDSDYEPSEGSSGSSSSDDDEMDGEEGYRAAGFFGTAGGKGVMPGDFMMRTGTSEGGQNVEAGSSSTSSTGIPSLFPTPTNQASIDKANQARTGKADALHAVRLAVHRGMDEDRILDIMKSYPRERYDIIEKRVQAVMDGKSYEQAGISVKEETRGLSSTTKTSEQTTAKMRKTSATMTSSTSDCSPPGIFHSSAKLVWDNPIIRDCIIENIHRPGGKALRHRAIARLITLNKATFETTIKKLYYDRDYMQTKDDYMFSNIDLYARMLGKKASQVSFAQ